LIQKRGRPTNPPKAKELLKGIIPVNDIFEEDELPMYNALIDIYLKDFDTEDISSGDMDDIMSLATNKILEIRLLKSSKGSAAKHLDVSAAVEKLRKQNDKIKENLSTRRKDRIEPGRIKGISIVDFAVAFEEDKKRELQERIERLGAGEDEALEKRVDYKGNRYDPDAEAIGGNND
jgi:hypothetical protein